MVIAFILGIPEKGCLCFHLVICGLWTCARLWQSTRVRDFIGQRRPGYTTITSSPEILVAHKQPIFIYGSYRMAILASSRSATLKVEAGSAPTSWMSLITATEGRRALNGLVLAVKCSGPEVTCTTSGHSPLTHCSIQPQGNRKWVLPCAQKKAGNIWWKAFMANITLIASKCFWTYLWDGKQPWLDTGVESLKEDT